MAGTPGPATGPVARPAHQPGAGQVPAVPPGSQQPAFERGVRLCAEQDLRRDPGLFRPVQWSPPPVMDPWLWINRKSTRLNSSHVKNSYAVFSLKKKKNTA